MALATGVQEVQAVKQELMIPPKMPIIIKEDNQAAIRMAKGTQG